MSSSPPVPKIYFGSSQERQFVPFSFPPSRLGSEFKMDTAPNIGPGSYDNHQYGTIVYVSEKTPMSKKGYGLSARTAERFSPASKSVSPSPQQYQPDQSLSWAISPGKSPFGLKSERFKMAAQMDDGPGPGSYSAFDLEVNRKVSWPMCFGSPDWSRLPQLDKRSLRVKIHTDKELLKQRSRVAYLSLYY